MSNSLQHLARTNWKYRLFHYAPMLKNYLGDNADDMLDEFLLYADINKLSLDWRFHFYFLNWLASQKEVPVAIAEHCLVACVTRWSLSGLDHVASQGVVLMSRCLPSVAIIFWKSEALSEAGKVSRVTLLNVLKQDAVAFITKEQKLSEANWLAL